MCLEGGKGEAEGREGCDSQVSTELWMMSCKLRFLLQMTLFIGDDATGSFIIARVGLKIDRHHRSAQAPETFLHLP